MAARSPGVICRALGAALALLLAAAGGAAAQDYPSRPIQMIVPFTAGGSTDVLGRIVGQRLSEILGRPVVINNRGGADGRIGMGELARAEPDGYTILFCTTSTRSINPGLYPGKLPYDPDTAFVDVALAASAPNILVVNNDLPVRSVAELIALSKRRSGGLNAGSGATMLLLNLRLLEARAGGEFVTVSYKGTGPALNDLMGGHVDVMFDQITTSLPLINDGRLRALAVTSAERFPGLPAVPTMAEAGVGDFETSSWWGVLAPSRTPAPIVARLNGAINEALRDPGVIERIRELGALPAGGTPRQFHERAEADRAVWAEIIRRYRVVPD